MAYITVLSVAASALNLFVTEPNPSSSESQTIDLKRQRTTTSVGDVIVTGRRQTENSGTRSSAPLIEIPQSITHISHAELERRNAQSIVQALDYVAGVAPNQRGTLGARYDQLAIRGFSPTVFVNGMRSQGGNYATPQIDFHLVDSLEAIKGPASVLYGNSTPGGLINLSLKTPRALQHGLIEIGTGSNQLWRGSIDVGGPLTSEGKLRGRLVTGGERSDGYAVTTTNERLYVSPSVSFVPDDRTILTLIGTYQHDPSSGGYGFVNPFGSVLPNPNGQLPRNFYDGDPNYERFDREQWSLTGIARRDLGRSITYRGKARYYEIDQSYRSVSGSVLLPDYRTLRRSAGGSDEAFRTFTTDHSLTGRLSTGPFKHEILVGADYLDNRGTNQQKFSGVDGSVPNLDIFMPVYGIDIPDLVTSAAATNLKRNQLGLYIQDQVRWGDLHLIASARSDRYEQSSETAGALSHFTQTKQTYRAGVLYAFDSGVSPYMTWSTSFEPQGGVNLSGQPYRPITGRQFEAGFKYQPADSIGILTVSIYDLARQNVLVADPDNSRNTIQVGETRTRGLEIEGRGEITQGVDVTLAVTYMDAEYKKGNPVDRNVINGLAQSGVTGTRVLGIPQWTASSFVSWDLATTSRVSGPWSGLTVGAGARYVGANDGLYSLAWNGVTTLGRFSVPGYVLADAMLRYDLGILNPKLEGMSLAMNASNVFDKRYVTSCYVANWCFYGAPRTVTASLRYQW